jgi:VWFA-related protein
MHARLAVLGFAAMMTAAMWAQEPTGPTFRGQVDIVSVDVFVTDPAGVPVPNLTLDDFELFEDGRQQAITSFAAVDIPINPPPPFTPSALRADVATNEGSDGRLYVIALDEITPDLALRARHYLRTFIAEHFEPNDVGVIVNLGRAARSEAQDFTSDRGLLLAAVDKLKGWPPADLSAIRGAVELQRRAQAAALKALINSLARIPARRKALIYIGQNTMGDVYRVIDYRGGVLPLELEDLRAAITEAMRGGVAIYALHACGLSPGGTLGETETREPGACDADLDVVAQYRRLASATGGFALVNSNDFDQALARVVQENSTYYVLGFSSTNDRRDGRYRRLEVRVRRPGLTVRTRDGYIAPSQSDRPVARTPPAALTARDIVASPVENATVPVRVFAAAFKGAGRNDATVVITAEVDGSQLGFAARDNPIRGQVEVVSAAVSAGGKITHGPEPVFDLALDSETYERAAAHGIRVVSALTLRPDRYQLRVAAGNSKASRLGSVMYDLEVPDFNKSPLALSTVVLMTAADRSVTATPKALAGVLSMAPTVKREFASGTSLSLYFEAYVNSDRREFRTVDVNVELRDQQQVFQTVRDRRTRKDRGTETFSVAVPLDVQAGSYALHVEATSGTTRVSRDIPIRIR